MFSACTPVMSVAFVACVKANNIYAEGAVDMQAKNKLPSVLRARPERDRAETGTDPKKYRPRCAKDAEKLRFLGATREDLRKWFGVHEFACRPHASKSSVGKSPGSWLSWTASQYHRTQAPPFHLAHLRTSRRTWRLVVLATQTPLIRTLPAPHASRTCVIMPSD
jgi:hypothetical protein